jgi:pimeloyl-ACP methyl ester carboxylesterase
MRLALRIFLTMAVIAAVVFVGACAALFAFQRSLIYYPQPRSNTQASTLTTLPGGVNVSTVPRSTPDAVLYYGGNGEDVSEDAPDLTDTFPHSAIYLLHYPGYGGSSGRPTQQAIFAAALALYDRAHADHPNITIIGRSLGTGVATFVASQRPVVRLILVTPFDSLGDAAAAQYPFLPVRWLLLDKYESWRYAAEIIAPTLILVAADDEIIPRSSSDRLRTRFRSGLVSYVLIPDASHNTISQAPNYWALLSAP